MLAEETARKIRKRIGHPCCYENDEVFIRSEVAHTHKQCEADNDAEYLVESYTYFRNVRLPVSYDGADGYITKQQ
ncbi:unknown [Ruminococcus sp. CAG:382]|nr:unknown [Ruminococcus sp. CAG:382]